MNNPKEKMGTEYYYQGVHRKNKYTWSTTMKNAYNIYFSPIRLAKVKNV